MLPSYAHLVRWLGEPVKAVSIPTETFICNKKGAALSLLCPYLSQVVAATNHLTIWRLAATKMFIMMATTENDVGIRLLFSHNTLFVFPR